MPFVVARLKSRYKRLGQLAITSGLVGSLSLMNYYHTEESL